MKWNTYVPCRLCFLSSHTDLVLSVPHPSLEIRALVPGGLELRLECNNFADGVSVLGVKFVEPLLEHPVILLHPVSLV